MLATLFASNALYSALKVSHFAFLLKMEIPDDDARISWYI